MVSGHIGVAFAIRAVRRNAPLPALLVASILPDIFDLGYALAGFCSPMGLYSHSLPAIAIISSGTFLATLAVTKNRGVAAAMAAVVLLHVPADWITGYKLLWSGGPVVGLVLYDHLVADFILEVSVVYLGWYLLRRDAKAPPWATAGITLAILVLGQAAANGAKLVGGSGKPSGCGARIERTAVSP